MNSPEEKAKDLIIAFSPFVTTWNCYHDCPENPDSIKEDAQKCALICVDEIIAALNKVVDDSMHVDDVPGSIGGANYYQQVKEAIRKL